MMSPYSTAAQKAATRRKLSHGSPVVHVIRPTSRFSGSRNGWLYASARVICGGVASSSGDFWCTRMVLLLLAAEVALGVVVLSVAGEKAA
jgi:hypothetical protein